MTVTETITALMQFPGDMTVYVPDRDGTAQIAKRVVCLVHVNVPFEGVCIPPDVAILSEDCTEDYAGY